jgi:beta-galactosidase
MKFDRFLYGVCYYPEHWERSRHASDIARIADAGFDYVRIGEGAWSCFEPEEGQFQFDLFDRVLDLCRKYRVKAIFGTPTYCGPAWIAQKYPEVLRWNFNRIPMAHGSRRNYNYTSPRYLELSDRICSALAEHYRSEKQIIGWQLDNELNCHMDVSYAPSDTLAFRRWLRAKYKTLGALNRAWGAAFWSQTYSSWDQLDLPHPTAAMLNPHQQLDESRFISDTVVAFARRQAQILRKANPAWFITHNALFGNVDGVRLTAELDVFSHDQYPLFSRDWTGAAFPLQRSRSLSFPYGVLEQQSGPGGQMHYFHRTPRPGELRLWAWQSVAHGAAFLSYFRWRTCPYGSEQHWHGLLDADNRDTSRLHEAKSAGREFHALSADFLKAPPQKQVGVMRDFDNDINDGRINTYTRSGRQEPQRWLAALSRRHIPADVVWPSSDLAGYRVLVLPHLKIMTKALGKKLDTFVRAGGILLLGAQSGSKDENLHMVECPLPGLLAHLAGVDVRDWSTFEQREAHESQRLFAKLADGRLIPMGTFVENVECREAKALAFWDTSDRLFSGGAALTVRKLGKGRVYYYGGYLQDDGIGPMLEFMAHEAGLKPLADASAEVEILRRAAGRKSWTVLLNHSTQPQRVAGVPAGKLQFDAQRLTDGDLLLPPWGVAVVAHETAKRAK